MRIIRLLAVTLAACTGSPNNVQIELSPPVISSLDGTTTIAALVAADTTPLDGEPVHVTIAYKDRNGTAHDIAPIEGKTDARGVFHATIEGLSWDGVGTVTVAASSGVSGTAAFSVLDRTPPRIEILPPTTDLRVGPGLPLDVQVKITDEIGVSEVWIDGLGPIQGNRDTVVASGTLSTTLTFRMDVEQNAKAGPTIELHALASDLSGNYAAAPALTLTVDPAITIATPPGLQGSVLVAPSSGAPQLVNPRAIAISAKDNHLYVADQAPSGACFPSCIWRIDATSGAIDAAPLVVGTGRIEGVAFDATSDNLYYTDRPDHTARMTWNGSAYTGSTACSDPLKQQPQDPYHLIVDPALGLLIIDDNSPDVVRVATCSASSVGTALSTGGSFDQPRGIAAGRAGEIFVSDLSRDRVSRVDTATGAVTPFETDLQEPYGMEWVPGTTEWANTLMVAAYGDQIVASTRGTGSRAAAYLANPPVDLAFAGGTMYVVTAPGAAAGSRGRIFQVTGF